LVYKNDTVATYNLILEQYLQNRETSKGEKLFGLSFRDGANFNCWRGYQAVYKIENDSLFLVDILKPFEIRSGKIDKIASAQKILDIFGVNFKNGRVYIDWFSGDINFPLSKNVIRWDSVFYKIFEKEKVIDVRNGKVLTDEDVVNYVHDPDAIDRRDKSKISDILFKELKKIKWKKMPECDCSNKYLVTIGADGWVSRVKLNREDDEPGDDDEQCMNIIFNKLKKLRFDIIKNKGKPIEEDIYIELWITEDGKMENWTR